ncbi:hypothetical protein, partial [Thiolapillus sp.]|uniref:hypothetical protein n=1 Tax=Thiolapillus sp. TaxID=2017437 RepID=UPI003AF8F892
GSSIPIKSTGEDHEQDYDNWIRCQVPKVYKEVNAKLEKPVNFLANWRQNKGIRRGVSGACLL